MLLDDMSDYMMLQGFTFPINKGSFQDTPDTVLALRETGGFPSQHVMASPPNSAVMEEPTVQVLARAPAYDTAEAIVRIAKSMLDGLRDMPINGVLYYWVTALQPPFLLERDANQRFILAFNVHIKRQTRP